MLLSAFHWPEGGQTGEGGPPLLGRCVPQTREGARQGCSPQQPCRRLPPGLALGQETAWDPPAILCLVEVTSTPTPRVLSQPTKQEGAWAEISFSNSVFTGGVNQMSPQLKTPKCKATKWYSKFRSCATLGSEELRSYVPR